MTICRVRCVRVLGGAQHCYAVLPTRVVPSWPSLEPHKVRNYQYSQGTIMDWVGRRIFGDLSRDGRAPMRRVPFFPVRGVVGPNNQIPPAPLAVQRALTSIRLGTKNPFRPNTRCSRRVAPHSARSAPARGCTPTRASTSATETRFSIW